MLCVFEVLHTCNWCRCATADRIVVGHLAAWAIPTTATSSPGGLLQGPARAQDTEPFFLGGSVAHWSSSSVVLKGTVEQDPWIADISGRIKDPEIHLQSLSRNWKISGGEIELAPALLVQDSEQRPGSVPDFTPPFNSVCLCSMEMPARGWLSKLHFSCQHFKLTKEGMAPGGSVDNLNT